MLYKISKFQHVLSVNSCCSRYMRLELVYWIICIVIHEIMCSLWACNVFTLTRRQLPLARYFVFGRWVMWSVILPVCDQDNSSRMRKRTSTKHGSLGGMGSGDPVEVINLCVDSDRPVHSGSLFHFLHLCRIGDLLAFLMQSLADFLRYMAKWLTPTKE